MLTTRQVIGFAVVARRILVCLMGVGVFVGIPDRVVALPSTQAVSVGIDRVQARGFNLDRSQYVRITIDGKRSDTIELIHDCRGGGGCTTSGYDDDCSQGGPHPMDIIRQEARFTTKVGICKTKTEGRIELSHRFFAGSDTVVVDDRFEIDLERFRKNSCAFGETAGNEGGVTFTVRADQTSREDSDGDGLLDGWEVSGLDSNCDGVMARGDDVFLHEMGVSPNHKDLLVQMDWFHNWEPSAAAVAEVRAAFANAPKDAGGIENPDNLPGINLIVDAGDFIDPFSNTLVGNDLGVNARGGRDLGNPNGAPGQPFVAPTTMAEMTQFAAEVLTDRARSGVFRFMLYGPAWDDFGGIATIRGDFTYLDRTDGSAVMHEIGHNLNLRHGGDEGRNCKPNHLSIMNYTYAGTGGLPFNGATGWFLDFAPSQIPNTALGRNARLPVLPDLNERNLPEDVPLVATTAQLFPRQDIIFNQPILVTGAPPTTVPVRETLSDAIDWNRDRLFAVPGVDPPVRADIDWNEQIDACSASANRGLTTLTSFDEWRNIGLKPVSALGSELTLGSPEGEWLPKPEEIAEARRRLTQADLTIEASAVPTPVTVDSEVGFRILVANKGPNPAEQGSVTVTVPLGVSWQTPPSSCTFIDTSSLRCSLKTLPVGGSVALTLKALVGLNETGRERKVRFQVGHAGSDPVPLNNVFVLPLHVAPLFAGFEDDDRQWVASWQAPAQPITVISSGTHGNVMAAACGYSSSDSPTFDTSEWEVLGDTVTIDVFVPVAQSNPWWVGDIALTFDLPAAGIYSRWLGHSELTGLTRGVWNSISIAIPQDVQDALLGDWPDARFRIEVNAGSCVEPLLLDNLRFEGDIQAREAYHSASGGAARNSVGPLSFDLLSDWNSNEVTLVRGGLHTEGVASLGFASKTWIELKSRIFRSNEHLQLGGKFAVDVYVPELPAQPDWVGALQLYAECPAANLYNAFVDQKTIYPSFDGEFNAIEFDVPAYVRQALASTSAGGCFLKFALALNERTGTFYLDNAGFYDH